MSKGHFTNAGYHLRMLRDTVRTEAFAEAIAELVKPGMVVVDLGAGTGILSLFAARAGARKVYAIEATPMARLARSIVKDNGLEDVIEVLEADARTVQLPELADVLVSECLGTFAFSDAMFNVLADSKRFLKPTGVMCPDHISVKVAPASIKPLVSDLKGWEEVGYGFSMRSARQSSENDIHCLDAPSTSLRGAAQTWMEFALSEPVQDYSHCLTWSFPNPCIIDGVIGWFEARLTPTKILDTGPGIRTHWGQVIFPMPSTEMVAGDLLRLDLAVELDKEDLPIYHWSGAFTDPEGNNALTFSRSQSRRFDPPLEE